MNGYVSVHGFVGGVTIFVRCVTTAFTLKYTTPHVKVKLRAQKQLNRY